MTGTVRSGGSISPNHGSGPAVIPKESKGTYKGIGVSATEGQPIVQQASEVASEIRNTAPMSSRKVAQQRVKYSLSRRQKSAQNAVKRVLDESYETSGMDRFEKRLRREVLTKLRRKGGQQSDATANNQWHKQVKKAVSLNKKLIKQRGDMVVNPMGRGEKQNVQQSPVTETKGLSDFLALDKTEQENIATHVMLCDAAYQGFDPDFEEISLPAGCTLLKQEELPVELQMLYDEATGLIHAPHNAKAMVVRKGDGIVVIFAGTEPGAKRETGRSSTIKTDVTQWLGMESPMYHSAAAVFDLLLKYEPLSGSPISAAGHSLGGGLAQFAYTAVQERYAPKRFGGVITVNSAGLSKGTLTELGEERVNMAKDSIQNIRIKGDPVSPSGTNKAGLAIKGELEGSIMTLPDPEKRGVGVHSCTVAIDVIEAHMSMQVDKDSWSQ